MARRLLQTAPYHELFAPSNSRVTWSRHVEIALIARLLRLHGKGRFASKESDNKNEVTVIYIYFYICESVIVFWGTCCEVGVRDDLGDRRAWLLGLLGSWLHVHLRLAQAASVVALAQGRLTAYLDLRPSSPPALDSPRDVFW